MRKSLRFLVVLAGMLWTGLLALMLVILRYMLRTPQPLQSALSGEAHLYKWTQGHIYYHTQGSPDAPAIVLLHAPGIAASSYAMRSLMDALATQYHVYAPDLLGFGQSDHPSLIYSADMYVTLCRDFLKDVVGRPATLVASGISCNYSVAVAAQEPLLCERLILLSPTSLFKKRSETPRLAPVITTPAVALALYALLTRKPLLRRVLAWQYGRQPKAITDEQMAYYTAMAHQFGAEHAPIAWLVGMLAIDVRSLFDQLRQPMLFLWGVHALNDEITFLNQHPLSQQAHLVLVHNAGLSVQEEQPETIIANIRTWLATSIQPTLARTQARSNMSANAMSATQTPYRPQSPVVQTPQPPLKQGGEKHPGASETIARAEAQEEQEIEGSAVMAEAEHVDETERIEADAAEAFQAEVEAYCVKCKQKRPMLHPQEVITKNGRHALEDVCPVCGRKLFRFIASQEE